MRKLALSLAALAVAVGLAAAPTGAGPPTHVFLEDDAMFQSGGLTAGCGFPVFITIKGGIHIMLRTDRNGILHELDTFSDWSITFSAPSQGTSFSYKLGPASFVYPEGTAVGAPAIVTIRGVDTRVTGFPAQAGRTVFMGEVLFVSPEGVPVADLVSVISQTGNQLSPAESFATICAALTA
jgi:hypothetical protein